MIICVMVTPGLAIEVKNSIGFNTVSLWGENTCETTYTEGASTLTWPISMSAFGVTYGVDIEKILLVEFSLATTPWEKSSEPLKDSDWLNESYFPLKTPHDGIDVYSETEVDMKGLLLHANSHLSLITYEHMSFGLITGYRHEEYDYKAYNTKQFGYGPWQNQTNTVSGPVSTYSIAYDIWDLGISYALNFDDILIVTLDTSVMPEVRIHDEDNHIKRSRVSKSNCSGYGNKTELATRFNAGKSWYISSLTSINTIKSHGKQLQLWYGDDPASDDFDDTGHSKSNIITRIEQKSFSINLSIGRIF